MWTSKKSLVPVMGERLAGIKRVNCREQKEIIACRGYIHTAESCLLLARNAEVTYFFTGRKCLQRLVRTFFFFFSVGSTDGILEYRESIEKEYT